MARRKITQATADKIRKEYEAIITGRSDRTLDEIQAKYGIARTTIYALRDKGWDVMARPPRAGSLDGALAQESHNALRARVELLENEVRSLRTVVEGLGKH